VFRRVAEASLRYLGVSAGAASAKAEGSRAVSDPVTSTSRNAGGAQATPVMAMSLGPGEVRVPDAMGLGARDAMRAVTSAGLLPEIEGSGTLVRQTPQPGAAAPKGGVVHLVFEPPS
jgi:cell division protein FtsI (penicillin-binding protein 3)